MLETILKNNKFFNKMYTIFGSIVVKFIGIMVPINKRKILFSSGIGNFIGDSPLYIYKEIKKDPYFDKFELVWAVNDPKKYPEYNTVKLNSFSYLITALSARVWITSVNIERGLRFKRNKNFYINTWHGIPLKYIGNDVPSRSDYDLKQINIFLVSGQYEKDIYIRAFNLKQSSIRRYGLPRNIELEEFKEENSEEIYRELHLDHLMDKKIILYAPTWRNYHYEELDLDFLEQKLGDDYYILVKSHPLQKLEVSNENIVDVSHVSDVVSLMKISDILISDYSSIMIDYGILQRPIYAYIPDYKKYTIERGLYVSEENLAPNVFNNIEDMVKSIQNIDYKIEQKKTKEYVKQFIEVSACDSIANIVREIQQELEDNG